MKNCVITATILAAILSSPSSSVADEVASSTTSPLFQVTDGRIVFPGFDDRQATSTAANVVLSPADFPEATVYRDQVLVADKPIKSRQFDIPTDATTVSILARSRPAGDIFPRIRVSLVTQDNNHHKLFEGYWQTISLETYSWPASEWVRGKSAHFEIEILNPGRVEEDRTWYFQKAEIR